MHFARSLRHWRDLRVYLGCWRMRCAYPPYNCSQRRASVTPEYVGAYSR